MNSVGEVSEKLSPTSFLSESLDLVVINLIKDSLFRECSSLIIACPLANVFESIGLDFTVVYESSDFLVIVQKLVG